MSVTFAGSKATITFQYSHSVLLKSAMKKSQTSCIEAEAYGFDDLQLREDFYQFVEAAAKEHVNDAKLKTTSSEGSGKKDKKKSRKVGSLISWWKADKKIKHRDSKVSGKRVKGHVSFQLYSFNFGKGPISSSNMKERRRRPTTCGSGPLTSLFKSTKREESESEIPIPYMPLHQQNGPRAAVHNYGPLYVVT